MLVLIDHIEYKYAYLCKLIFYDVESEDHLIRRLLSYLLFCIQELDSGCSFLQ